MSIYNEEFDQFDDYENEKYEERKKRERQARKDKRFNVFATVISIILVLMIILLIIIIGYKFLFINVQVSGDSMNPTLHNEDLYVISKLAKPERGDIIVVNISEKKDKDGNDFWIIKRVIAVEGDSVKIENGKVNLKKAGEDNYTSLDETGYTPEGSLTDGRNIEGVVQNEWIVGEDEVFFLGDNREHSSDSRDYGVRDLDDVVGVVTEWSRTKGGFWYGFSKFANFPSKIFDSWNNSKIGEE